jgi:hypothetical protein
MTWRNVEKISWYYVGCIMDGQECGLPDTDLQVTIKLHLPPSIKNQDQKKESSCLI